MTDNKIKKALEEAELFLRNRVRDGQPIKLSEYDTEKLRNISQTCAKAYDKITRQQTENENLTVENQSLRSAANSLKMHYEEAQAQIERLKSCVKSEDEVIKIAKRTMEPLVKEITREQIDIAVKYAKSEAYKECLAKVKNYIKTHCNPYGKPDFDYDTSIKILNFIDDLVVGE